MKIILVPPGFEPTDYQNIAAWQTGALATAAMTSYSKSSRYNWCNLTIFFYSKLCKVGTSRHKHLEGLCWLEMMRNTILHDVQVEEWCLNSFWRSFETIFKNLLIQKNFRGLTSEFLYDKKNLCVIFFP